MGIREKLKEAQDKDRPQEIDWAWHPFHRCRAVLAPTESPGFFGRCELKVHSDKIEHRLERGMVDVLWESVVYFEVEGTPVPEVE